MGSTSDKVPATVYPYEARFSVTGPRFSLDPGDLVSLFPPPFSLGEFSNVLPHAVLSRTTLPWERSLDAEIPVNDPPWLGVILFDEGDAPPPTEEKTLLDLLPLGEKTGAEPDAPSGKLPPGTYFPPFPRRPETDFPDLDFGESWNDKCLVVDIPSDLFNRMMPTAEDLGWLAQVREIALSNKSETYLRKLRQTALRTPSGAAPQAGADDLDPVGQVAEVIGNRFALPGKRSVAHLVCLEGFGPILPGGGDNSNLPGDTDTVRLVSLKSWTFSAVSQEYTFAGLLLKVNKPGGVFTRATLQAPFQATGKPGDDAVANAFKMGLAAFDHTTRLGDKTVSWFHGPCVPYDLRATVPFPGNVADQFTRYNPDSGMFDVSYSAAWQLGRLLGLQSSGYSSALYNWKRMTTKAVIQSVEERFLNLPYGDMVSLLKQSLANYLAAPPLAAGSQSGAAVPEGIPGTGCSESPRDPIGKAFEGGANAATTVRAPRTVVGANRVAALRRTLSDPEAVQAALSDADLPELPGAVAGFLARLRLLYGLPFNYLVPDERMLPSESLRFFYLDSAWVDSLLEGALSLGNSTSGDAAIHQALSPGLRAGTHAGARNIRRSVLKMPAAAAESDSITPVANPTGFLLRSQVVTGWPGMEVHGFDATGAALDILRLEQIGPGVLLGIFNGVVGKLVLNEHPEALHFGVDEDIDDPSPAKFTKSFRYIAEVGGNPPGTPVPAATAAPLAVPDYTRKTESSVLRIGDLAAAMQAELRQAEVYAGNFTSAEFALEMIEGVGRVTYTFGA